MPLPPAPPKRAALLSTSAYNTPAQSTPKSSPRAVAEPAETYGPPPTASTTASVPERRPGLALVPAPAPATLRKDEPAQPARQRASTPAAKSTSPTKAAPRTPRRPRSGGPSKLFVLDTNVLL
ncbi:MAG TPA: PhoH family protein, partial [Burkholderiaceae bacterium]